MTPIEAACLLDLSPDATREQLEARFHELRAKFSEKIAHASTPELKEKYRCSLVEITAAFDVLTVLADRLDPSVSQQVTSAGPAPIEENSATAASTKFGAQKCRFVIFTLVVVLLLGGGGWFGVRTRAAAAEKASVETARLAAEENRRVREESFLKELRATQAELKSRWSLLETQGSVAKCKLSELQDDSLNTSEVMNPQTAELHEQYATQRDYVEWLDSYLVHHPVQLNMAKLDELLSGKALTEAAMLATEVATTLGKAETEVVAQKKALLVISAPVKINSDPTGQAYVYTDFYGRSVQGKTPFVGELPLGSLAVKIVGPRGWPDNEQRLRVKRGEPLEINAVFGRGKLTVTSIPSGLAYTVKNVAGFTQSGTTPCDIVDVPIGEVAVVVNRKNWPAIEQSVRVSEGGSEIVAAEFAPGSLTVCSEPTGAEVWEAGKQLGVTPLRLNGLIPGTHSYELRLKGYDKRAVSGQVRAHEVSAISQALVRFLGPKEGDSFIIPDLKLGLVPIAGGSFEMGDWSDETTPLHKVTLSQGYWLGRTEVTQGQYSAVMHSGPSHYRGDNNLPVECVSWDDASNFCRKLTERERAAGRLLEGYTYCLPTEAQWEYACRAGGKGESGGGKGLDDMAWYGGKSGYSTHPVGQKRANAWGLYDMYGNVAEWCADRYGNYPSGAVINPTGSARGYSRVVRGGNYGSSASVCISTHRSSFAPRFFQRNLGFRVALSSGPREAD